MESEINKAVAYVSNNMDADELKVIKAQVNLLGKPDNRLPHHSMMR